MTVINIKSPDDILTAISQEDPLEYKTKLVDIKFKDSPINFADIWIKSSKIDDHYHPAKYLKWFKSSIKPELAAEHIQYINESLYITFKDWKWLKSPSPQDPKTEETTTIAQINVRLELRDYPFSVHLSLKILGFKKFIHRNLVQEKKIDLDTPYEKYFLYYKGYQLNDENTLLECGITEGEIIKCATQPIVNTPNPSLQLSTGGTYISTEDFEKYNLAMNKKTGIVCLIEGIKPNFYDKGCATGFLIGKNLIMTNWHAIPSKEACNGAKAKFFYENNKKEIEISLDGAVIECFSKSPKNVPTMDSLDFTIIRFKTNFWNPFKYFRMLYQFKIAHEFFTKFINDQKELKAAWKRYYKKKNDSKPGPVPGNNNSSSLNKKQDLENTHNPEPNWSPSSVANIIQHPSDKKTKQPLKKQIAFRENSIKELSYFLIHYKSETWNGTSGSPVLSDEGDFIGLHRSDCMIIEQKIFKYREKLFEKLNLGKAGPPPTWKQNAKMYSFENADGLQFHYKGNDKGYFRYKEGKSRFSILEFIEKKKIENPREFAFNFLKDQKDEIEKIHKFCNTGINAARIYENLELNKKLEAIEKAQKFSGDDLKQFVKILTPPLLLLGGMGGLYWFYKNKR